MDLPGAFRELADWAEGTSPLYERLCRGIARDDDALALAEEVPEDRSPPHVLLAAVHHRLLRGDDHDLAEFYPSVTDDPRDPTNVYPAFHDFCLSRAVDLRPALGGSRTQTNAVGRCAALYPGFARVASEARAGDGGDPSRGDGADPLALVELGPSAGLNLLWDRYAYDYGTGRLYGADSSPVRVESELLGGDPPLPGDPPPVAARVGVDRHPLDVTDPSDADWLRALVWPEHHERRALLEAALDVAREDPPRLVQGDAVDDVVPLVRDAPGDATVCVYNTSVLYQLSDERRATLRDRLSALGEERDVYWLSGEGDSSADGGMALELARFPDGEPTRLGRYEQHGRWLDWD